MDGTSGTDRRLHLVQAAFLAFGQVLQQQELVAVVVKNKHEAVQVVAQGGGPQVPVGC